MVYDVLENQTTLSRMYSILFNLLDMMSLRYTSLHLQKCVPKTHVLQTLPLSSVDASHQARLREAVQNPSTVSRLRQNAIHELSLSQT